MLTCSKCAIALISIAAAGLWFAGVLAPSNAASAEAPSPAPSPVESQATVYQIDKVHSTAVFRVKHLNVAYFYGRFNEITGSIAWDETDPAAGRIDVTINTESVDTANEGRNGHLRSPDFFNTKEYPAATFVSKSIERKSGSTYAVTGDLTLHGVTKTITADIEHTGSAPHPRGGQLLGLEAVFTIRRSDFNMNYGIENGALGDEVKLFVGLEALHR
jgi:polyisoprenoid-binding protein YceI